jgi:hypothetical protein
MCTMLIFKQLQVDSRGKVNILERVIVRNELYEHMSKSEGYQDRNIYELMNVCVCTHIHIKCLYIYIYIYAFYLLVLKSCVLMPKDSLHDQNM